MIGLLPAEMLRVIMGFMQWRDVKNVCEVHPIFEDMFYGIRPSTIELWAKCGLNVQARRDSFTTGYWRIHASTLSSRSSRREESVEKTIVGWRKILLGQI